MKKVLTRTVGIAFLLALIVFFGLQFFLGSIVTAGVNNFGSKVTKTEVKLGSARISPFSGVGTLTGLQIANPEGWSKGNLASVGRVHVDVKPFSILGDHIVINEIDIDEPEFSYESRLVASNIGDLLKNIEATTGGGGGSSASLTSKPMKIEVGKFVLRNGKVKVGIGLAAVTVPLPTITLENIGTGKGGVTPAMLTVEVMRSVTTKVVAAGVGAAAQKGVGEAAGATMKKATEIMQGVFGGKK